MMILRPFVAMLCGLAPSASVSVAAEAKQSAPVQIECGTRDLSACGNTNELVLAPDFRRAVKRFGGRARTPVLDRGDEPLWKALITTLHGPPNEAIRLADGSYLFAACMAHSCTEKGAVVLTRSGSITMAAMLTNHVVNEDDRNKLSGPHYARLDIYLVGPAAAVPPWHQHIRAWARAAYATDRKYFREVFQTYSTGLTEYRWLVSRNSPTLIPVSRVRIK